jgi:hypothetical protein
MKSTTRPHLYAISSTPGSSQRYSLVNRTVKPRFAKLACVSAPAKRGKGVSAPAPGVDETDVPACAGPRPGGRRHVPGVSSTDHSHGAHAHATRRAPSRTVAHRMQ